MPLMLRLPGYVICERLYPLRTLSGIEKKLRCGQGDAGLVIHGVNAEHHDDLDGCRRKIAYGVVLEKLPAAALFDLIAHDLDVRAGASETDTQLGRSHLILVVVIDEWDPLLALDARTLFAPVLEAFKEVQLSIFELDANGQAFRTTWPYVRAVK